MTEAALDSLTKHLASLSEDNNALRLRAESAESLLRHYQQLVPNLVSRQKHDTEFAGVLTDINKALAGLDRRLRRLEAVTRALEKAAGLPITRCLDPDDEDYIDDEGNPIT